MGRFLRLTGLTAGGFLSLTAPLAPRVVVAAGAASSKKGRGWRRWLGPPVGGGLCRKGREKVLKIDRPMAGGFLGLTAPLAPRVVVAASPQFIAAFGGIAACRQRKPNNLASLVEMHPFCLRHLSTGKRLTKFSVALWLPTNFVRLPPRRGRF